MKKNIFLLFFLSMILINCSSLQAQDMSQLDYNFGNESGAAYWDDTYGDYDNYNGATTSDKNNYENLKPVSDKEFEDALATKEKYGYSYKQRQKIQKLRKKRIEMESERGKATPLNPTPCALLRLPVSVALGDNVLIPGFYLLDVRDTGEEKTVIIKRGNEPVAEITGVQASDQKQKVSDSFVIIDSLDDTVLSLTLNTKYSVVKFNLKVYGDIKQ